MSQQRLTLLRVDCLPAVPERAGRQILPAKLSARKVRPQPRAPHRQSGRSPAADRWEALVVIGHSHHGGPYHRRRQGTAHARQQRCLGNLRRAQSHDGRQFKQQSRKIGLARDRASQLARQQVRDRGPRRSIRHQLAQSGLLAGMAAASIRGARWSNCCNPSRPAATTASGSCQIGSSPSTRSRLANCRVPKASPGSSPITAPANSRSTDAVLQQKR